MTGKGLLSVVATPIGNISDLSVRAIKVLRGADRVLCEDTRRAAVLLQHHGIETPLESMHEHNEAGKCHALAGHMLKGAHFALVSDAGTPLISDPGYRLVLAAHEAGVKVTPVPGACAAAAALSAAGMGASRFVFEGFIAAQRGARRNQFQALINERRTVVFYEAPHRIMASLEDMRGVFGNGRSICLAKEISKIHESILRGTIDQALAWLREDAARCRGEFVVVLEGAAEAAERVDVTTTELLSCLREHLPPGKAASVAASLTGRPRADVYREVIKAG